MCKSVREENTNFLGVAYMGLAQAYGAAHVYTYTIFYIYSLTVLH